MSHDVTRIGAVNRGRRGLRHSDGGHGCHDAAVSAWIPSHGATCSGNGSVTYSFAENRHDSRTGR